MSVDREAETLGSLAGFSNLPVARPSRYHAPSWRSHLSSFAGGETNYPTGLFLYGIGSTPIKQESTG
jgi:hypothetical protein